MGPIGCPETSVRNYHSKLRNNAEERRSRRKPEITHKDMMGLQICEVGATISIVYERPWS